MSLLRFAFPFWSQKPWPFRFLSPCEPAEQRQFTTLKPKFPLLELQCFFTFSLAYTYMKGLWVFTSIYWSAFTRITLNLSQNPVMSKQQLHFFELRAGRSRNVKKGGDLMGMDLILLDGKVTETFSVSQFLWLKLCFCAVLFKWFVAHYLFPLSMILPCYFSLSVYIVDFARDFDVPGCCSFAVKVKVFLSFASLFLFSRGFCWLPLFLMYF